MILYGKHNIARLTDILKFVTKNNKIFPEEKLNYYKNLFNRIPEYWNFPDYIEDVYCLSDKIDEYTDLINIVKFVGINIKTFDKFQYVKILQRNKILKTPGLLFSTKEILPNIFEKGIFDNKLLNNRTDGKVLLIDRINDPQNIGAILRSAEAFGFQMVFSSIKDSAKITQAVHQSSTGAALILPIVFINLNQAISQLKQAAYKIIAAGLQGDDISDISKLSKYAIIIGSESSGIRKSLVNSADLHIRIATSGITESLNASVSFAVIAHYLSTPS